MEAKAAMLSVTFQNNSSWLFIPTQIVEFVTLVALVVLAFVAFDALVAVISSIFN
jgi:hypothetical protein